MTKTRKEQAQDSKRAILLAAYDIVRRQGVDQLSANNIALVAGISKSGFFHHFRQVEDLYLYILDELMLSLRQSVSMKDHGTLSSLIDYLAESFLVAQQAHPEMIPILLHFFSLCRQNPEYLRRLRGTSEQMFSDWVEELAVYTNERMTKATLDELVRLIDSFFLGFAIHNLLFDDVTRYRKLAHNFGEMLEKSYVQH